MIVYVNGETRDCAENCKVANLVNDLGLTGNKIALE